MTQVVDGVIADNFLSDLFWKVFDLGGLDDDEAINRAIEWTRGHFQNIGNWSEERKSKLKDLGDRGEYRNAVWDEIRVSREIEIPEVYNLSQEQIWLVCDRVLEDSLIPDLFEQHLDLPNMQVDMFEAAVERTKKDFENLKHWNDNEKAHMLKRDETGDYRQAVEDLCNYRSVEGAKEYKTLSYDEREQVIDEVMQGGSVENAFQQAFRPTLLDHEEAVTIANTVRDFYADLENWDKDDKER